MVKKNSTESCPISFARRINYFALGDMDAGTTPNWVFLHIQPKRRISVMLTKMTIFSYP